MGDLGYFDDAGRLWFCGRKAHRVESIEGRVLTVPNELIFNTHREVFRTAVIPYDGDQGRVAGACSRTRSVCVNKSMAAHWTSLSPFRCTTRNPKNKAFLST